MVFSQVAVFFCFGTSHFCNACHDDFQRVTNIPRHLLPQCPAGELIAFITYFICSFLFICVQSTALTMYSTNFSLKSQTHIIKHNTTHNTTLNTWLLANDGRDWLLTRNQCLGYHFHSLRTLCLPSTVEWTIMIVSNAIKVYDILYVNSKTVKSMKLKVKQQNKYITI